VTVAKPPSFVGERGGKTKFQWNKAELTRLIGKASAIGLQKAGLEVRKASQRMIVGGSTRQGRKPLAKARWWKVGQKGGYPIVAYVKKVPRPDKVSSWAPQAFLRNDIEADFDPRSRSIVIGPSKVPWLNQLHEFGGSVNVYVRHTKYPVNSFAGQKVPQSMLTVNRGAEKRDNHGRFLKRAVSRGAYVGVFNNTSGAFFLGSRRVRPRAFMEIGLQAAMSKIPRQFQNRIARGSL
jgi:hypothetical protein